MQAPAAATSSTSPSLNLRDLLKLSQDDVRDSPPRRVSLASFLVDEAAARTDDADDADDGTAPTGTDDADAGSAPSRTDDTDATDDGFTPGKEPRMSLLALLEDDDDEVGDGESRCCVCMARRKGAAFIPCGHTFCRVCARQLSLSRRPCPLCNSLILDVLHIF